MDINTELQLTQIKVRELEAELKKVQNTLADSAKFHSEAFKCIAEAIKTLGDGLEDVKAKKILPEVKVPVKRSFIQKILGK